MQNITINLRFYQIKSKPLPPKAGGVLWSVYL